MSSWGRNYKKVTGFCLTMFCAILFSGCERVLCPRLQGGTSLAALEERAYAEVMYDFNDCPPHADLYTSTAMHYDAKKSVRPRIVSLKSARDLFEFKLLDATTTHAIVQMKSLAPDRLNWSFFGGAVQQQEWILDGGQWRCNGLWMGDDPLQILVSDPASYENEL